MEFRVASGSSDQLPGWFCENPRCGYRVLARPATKPSWEERRRALVERAARAHRRSMAVRARSERLKLESDRIRAARPRRKK
jgi:hypothetical protein